MYKLTLDKLPNFLLGGRADFVVKDINTGDHINYKIIKIDKTTYNLYYIGIRKVYLGKLHIIVIDDNPYRFDFVNLDNQDLKSKQDIIKKLILYILQIKIIPRNLEIVYTGICSMCGRTLSDPESIERGIGKVCLTKI